MRDLYIISNFSSMPCPILYFSSSSQTFLLKFLMKFCPIEEKGQIWLKKNTHQWKIKEKDIVKGHLWNIQNAQLLIENIPKKRNIFLEIKEMLHDTIMLRILKLVYQKTNWNFIRHFSYIDWCSYILLKRTFRESSFVTYERKLKIDNF